MSSGIANSTDRWWCGEWLDCASCYHRDLTRRRRRLVTCPADLPLDTDCLHFARFHARSHRPLCGCYLFFVSNSGVLSSHYGQAPGIQPAIGREGDRPSPVSREARPLAGKQQRDWPQTGTPLFLGSSPPSIFRTGHTLFS